MDDPTKVREPIVCADCGKPSRNGNRRADGSVVCNAKTCWTTEVQHAAQVAYGMIGRQTPRWTLCSICGKHRAGRLFRCTDLSTGASRVVCDKGYCQRQIAIRMPLRRLDPWLGTNRTSVL